MVYPRHRTTTNNSILKGDRKMNRYQLADAMIKGLNAPNVKESQTSYINNPKSKSTCWACALGCALIGHYDGNCKQAYEAWRDATIHLGEYDAFSDLLGITPALAVEIEFKHMNGINVQQIAAWLKSSDETEVKTI
jgi:hypothetical protein